MSLETIQRVAELVAWVTACLAFIAAMDAAAVWFFQRRKKGAQLPHQYSTGPCHSPTPGESCNSARRDCVICKGGA